MTSSNLRRWISPFPPKPEYEKEIVRPTRDLEPSVEYHSMCISLVLGTLNDVFGNIKSSKCLACIHLSSTDLLCCEEQNAAKEKKKKKLHPTDCDSDQWISDQREITPNEGFFCWNQLLSLITAESEETAFVSGKKNTHTHNEWNWWKRILYTLYV